MNRSKNRIYWVDILKGFSIILVLLGHSGIADPVLSWLYSFHMPLFFFLSGYVFTVKKYNTFSEFIFSKVRTLLIPMLFYGVLIKILHFLLSPSKSIMGLLKEIIIGGALQLGGSSYSMSLWFLVCLFVVQIGYWFILYITKDKAIYQIVILVMLSAAGYLYNILINKTLPWSLDAAVFAIGFFGCGYLIRNFADNIVEKIANWETIVICFIINIASVGVNLMLWGGHPDLNLHIIGIYPLYYTGAFSGIFASVAIAFRLKERKNSILTFVGRNSLVFYIFHKEVFYYIFDCFIDYYNIVAVTFFETQLKSVVYVLLSAFACGLIAFIINRYFGWTIGRRKKY